MHNKNEGKGKYMSQEEYDSIRDLHKLGYSQSQIAEAVNRSTSAICYVLKHAPKVRRANAGIPSHYDFIEQEEMDYKKLPDTAIFDFRDFVIY